MTPSQLQAATGCTSQNANKFCAAINAAMAAHGINTLLRQAYFISQIAHESGRFSVLEENLNYSAGRLMTVWPNRFPTMAAAQPFAGNAEKLANSVYANRMGNGQTESGDGYRFRGRGLSQLTGRNEYFEYQKDSGHPVLASPELLITPEIAADSAAWFWEKNLLNGLADRNDVVGITRRINGGQIGILERTRLAQQAKVALGVV